MQISKRLGKRSLALYTRPHIIGASSVVSDVEDKGCFCGSFDLVLKDDTWGEQSFEKAEAKMFEHAVLLGLERADLKAGELSCLLGGDLLNQIISANYAARQLEIPFLGLYSACSTIAEALLLGSIMVDGGYAKNIGCASVSHFSTAERQYRFPLEMGTTSPPTAQRTVTGAGAFMLSSSPKEKSAYKHVVISGATFGKVVDLGIKDTANMGAAMAPAAWDTISAHLQDTAKPPSYYDMIVTGDLGEFGSSMLIALAREQGVDISGVHYDCGANIYDKSQCYDSGGSGAGCAAVSLAAKLLGLIERGEVKRMLFLATGALMSPASSMQGESIPGVAHAVVLERVE